MYMRNLVRALALYGDPDIEICLFVGNAMEGDQFIRELRELPRVKLHVDAAFDSARRRSAMVRTIVTGRKASVLNIFRHEKIDVALDWATYFGWRSEIPTIAWIPDFQHRALPHLFNRKAWFRRELGFRLQIAASSKILLSSAASEQDCHAYYPMSRGRTYVARFAVPVDDWPSPAEAEEMLAVAGIPRDFVFLPNQLWHHKNHALAIDAASILARRGSDRTIVATGRGFDPRRPDYRAELVNRVRECKAEQNFILLDGVDHRLVKAMMTTTNALLNPSRFEGWSTTVEEAKAIGTPMLLSALPVHREQAPSARFFGMEDAEGLADAIQRSPVRDNVAIALAAAKVKALNLQSQKDFAQAVSAAVQEAVHMGRGIGGT
jgi:glycosyltransferase involved in cell wall biosynthesis